LASPKVLAAGAWVAGACVAGAAVVAAGAQPTIDAINTTAIMILNIFAVFIFHSPYEMFYEKERSSSWKEELRKRTMRGDNAENLFWCAHGAKMDIWLFLILRLLVWDFVHLLWMARNIGAKAQEEKTPRNSVFQVGYFLKQ
jgi:hypothetical protein